MSSPVIRFFSLVLAFALATASSFSQEIDFDINLGDSVNGQIVGAIDTDTVRFTGIIGTTMTITVKGKKGFQPTLDLLDAETEEVINTTAFSNGPGKPAVSIKKFPLPETKSYLVRVGTNEGEAGEYKLSVKGKISKELTSKKVEVVVDDGDSLAVPFVGDIGALLTATVKPSKKSDAVPSIDPIDTPTGTTDPGAFVKIKKTTASLKKFPLDEIGDHTFNITNDGAEGGLKVTLKIKFPKVKKTKYVEPTTPGTIEGDISVQQLAVQPEIEPNDNFGDEQILGGMTVGSLKRIQGSISSFQDVDAFQLQFTGPQTVSLVLLHDATPAGAVNLDIFVEDALTTEGLALFDSDSEPELALLDINQGANDTFGLNLVVLSNFGAAITGDYILQLQSLPLGAGLSSVAAAPVADATSDSEPAARPARVVAQNGAELTEEKLAAIAGLRPSPFDGPAMEGEFIVKLRDHAMDPVSWAAKRGMTVAQRSGGGHFLVRDTALLSLATADARRAATRTAMREAQLDPDVEYAEPNAILQAMREPNDTFYPLQWHYPSMNLPAAWDLTTGSSDVIVAVLDTGIFGTHPDLAARDSGYGIDMISSPQISLDGNGIDTDPTDAGDQINQDGTSSWHGTHVSGTIGAVSDNGSGVAGVDWACRLMHVRVLGKGGGTTFDIYEGVRYAARLSNASGLLPTERADVLNMSLGGFGFSQTAQNAVTAAFNAGCVIVAAAGNENTSQLAYPASYDNVISVSAMDFAKQRAPYSNFGSAIDVAAPGGNIQVDLNGDQYGDGIASTIVDDSNIFSLQPAYKFNQGTSMACPHVAGLCALMLAVNDGLSPSQVESLLKSSADDLGAAGRDDIYGDGFVNALEAVQAAQGGAGAEPILSVSPTTLNFGATLTSLIIGITNSGGGTLNVTDVTETELSGPTGGGSGWLSMTPNPAGILVSVNRTVAAANGVFTGNIAITTNAGNLNVPVTMEKIAGTTTTLDVGTIFVLAVNIDTLATVAQDTVTESFPGYTLSNVPVGSWLIAAGPDLDDDGFICGIGEPCGLYPVLSEPVLVGLDASDMLDAIDFSINESSVLPAAFGGGAAAFLPAQGLRLPTQQ